MSRVAPEDIQVIAHIEFTCESIHQFGEDLYENMMNRNYSKSREDCKKLIAALEDIAKSMEDEL
jgi:hypothetical protein|tara:strand:+ start:8882 stop:9073 length:192 start_codon:yes stop_codon:yes gene_type:complete